MSIFRKKHVTIYRVRHKKYKHGPYCHCKTKKLKELSDRITIDHRDFYDHPTNVEENIMGSTRHFSGFASLTQLFDWFDGYIAELHTHGYEIAVYKVSKRKVKYGKKQVAFCKPKKCTQTISLMEAEQ